MTGPLAGVTKSVWAHSEEARRFVSLTHTQYTMSSHYGQNVFLELE
jgi:hypothetical protein